MYRVAIKMPLTGIIKVAAKAKSSEDAKAIVCRRLGRGLFDVVKVEKIEE